MWTNWLVKVSLCIETKNSEYAHYRYTITIHYYATKSRDFVEFRNANILKLVRRASYWFLDIMARTYSALCC